MKYNKEECYGSIPNCLKWLIGMKKGSDKSFNIDLGYFFWLHDRHYRNERIQRYTRFKSDNLLRSKILSKFRTNNNLLLGVYVSSVIFITLRLFGGVNYE